MKTINRYMILLVFLPLIIFLSSCSETAENEHLPEYCQTYSGFMSTASKDLYDLVGGITRDEYLTAISVIELEFEVDDPYREINLDGIQCFQNLTSLTLIGQSFKDISPISALKNIQKISLIDTSVVSIDSFRNLSKIKELNITGTKTLQSVDGVEEMTKLTSLELIDNGIVNIDGLNNLVNLTKLDLSYNEISEFPNINRLTLLTDLNVSFNNIYVLGDDLSGLSALETFNASNNDICDLSTLDDLTKLVTLDLSFNNLGCDGSGLSPDFSSLENASNLTDVYLNNNELVSIEGLRGLDIELETLHLENNNLVDITPISEFTGITNLVLYGNNISNISNLSGMTGLTVIDLSDNLIVDFTDLLSIINLETVDLSNNLIETIPDLVDGDTLLWPRLIVLDLHSNLLTDTSGVNGHPSLRELILSDNGLTELRGISDLPELDYLEIFWEVPDLPVEDWPEDFVAETNPNSILVIRDSFNDVPSLPLIGTYVVDETTIITNVFDFGFETGPNLEIYNSINNIIGVRNIIFVGMDIDFIDEDSINLPNLAAINISGTDIEDISFILGNPELIGIDISNTPVSNLSVISGVDTSDLDNLDQVYAMNISGDNHLLNAFIELPELSIIYLSGTNIISIENSFNSLEELTTFEIDSSELVSIVDSFNDIYGFYTDENNIVFESSKIGIIDNSFNTGNYENIVIFDNSSIGITRITDSFNDLVISETGEFSINDNDFSTITGSFNNVTAGSLDLASNGIEVITGSFANLDVSTALLLEDNKIETIVDLNLTISIPYLNLANNYLTTVSFIDGINDLNTLNISEQYNSSSFSYTLTSLDGINNMPLLELLIMDNMRITEIDGLNNIAITEFHLSSIGNNNGVITSITSGSFTNTLVTDINLEGHDLNNVDFLDNFSELIGLTISVNLPNISFLQGSVYEANLISLTLENIQDTTDFSYLSLYDSLEFVGFTSENTHVINNFDGLPSLVLFDFRDKASITGFNNSLNDMPGLTLTSSYLDIYPSLSSISTSFDIYGVNDSVNLDESINIVNSFNNVGEVTLNSGVETTLNFDTLSFDNMDTLTITSSNFDSLSDLNNYANLNTLTINLLNKNITDLVNSNITSLVINNIDVTIDTFTLEIAESGRINLTNINGTDLTFNTVNDKYTLDNIGGNVVINLNNLGITLTGEMDDFTLNSSNLVSVNFINSSSVNSTFNTDLLNSMTTDVQSSTALVTNINSLEVSLDVSINTPVLNVNDVNANNYTLNTGNGDAYLNSNELDLIVNYIGKDLFIEYDLLESVDLTGSFTDLALSSNSLDTALLNDSIISTATITSDTALLAVSAGNTTNIDIINNSINDLTVDTLGAITTLVTSNSEILNLNAITTSFDLAGTNIPDIVFNDNSVIATLNISDGTSIDTLTFGNSSVSTIYLFSSATTLDISGLSVTSVTLDMANLSSIVSNTVSGVYDINTNTVAIDLDMIAQNIFVDSSNLTDINIQTTSIINSVSILDSPLIETVTANNANINGVVINSDSASVTLTGVNIVSSAISDNNLIGATIDVGTNEVLIVSTKTGSTSFNLTAGVVTLNVDLSTVSIDNSSTITELVISSSNLTNVLAGTSSISSMSISNPTTSLDVTGANILNLGVVGDITTFNASVGLTTVVNFEHTGTTLSTITTNTEGIIINSTGDIDITSSTLTSSTLNLGLNGATLDLSAAALDYSISGAVNSLTIDSTTLNNLIIDNLDIQFTLQLNDTNVSSIDFTNGAVHVVQVYSDITSFELSGEDFDTVNLITPNLNSFTLDNDSTINNLIIPSTSLTFDLNGIFNDVSVQSDLDTIDLTDANMVSLIINSDLMTSLNTLSSVTGTLNVLSNSNNFNLTTDTPVVSFTGVDTNNLNFNTTSATTLDLTTNVDSITFNTPLTDVSVDGENVNSVFGTAGQLVFNNNVETGTLLVNLDANQLFVDDSNYTQINVFGVGTLNSLSVGGELLNNVSTNTVSITSLYISNTAASINVDSQASNINVFSLLSNSVNFDVSVSGQNLESAVSFMSVSSVNNSSSNLFYTASANAELTLSGINEFTFDAPYTSDVILIGDTVDMILTGTSIDTINTTSFVTTNKYTMNDTLITDLSFISTGFKASLSEIEVNTLVSGNTSTIIEVLRDTGISLVSPITAQDINDSFYDAEFTDLTAQEVLDSVRYDGFRDTAILDAFTEIRTNTYFDHVGDIEINDDIDAQTYENMQYYLDGYILSIGTTEAQLTIDEGEPFVQAIRDSIQATLDQTILVIVELDLTNSVEQSIIEDSNSYATTESGLIGFTIG